MAEENTAPPEKVQTKFTRREFLIILGAGSASLTFAACGIPPAPPTEVPKQPTPAPAKETVPVPVKVASIAETVNPEELSKQILNHRKSLGFKSLPSGIVEASKTKDFPIGLEKSQFKNELPMPIEHYGSAAQEVLKATFGENYSAIIHGIRSFAKGTGISYEQSTQSILVSKDVWQFISFTEFPNHVLHEGAGHGTDPDDPTRNKMIYSKEDLWKIESAKWAMLSQAFSIPKEFLNQPDDGVHRSIGLDLGNRILDKIQNGKTDWFSDKTTLSQVKTALGKTLYLKNRKGHEEEIMDSGWDIYIKLIKEEVEFSQTFQEEMEKIFESHLGEIYAEMIRIAILHPKLLASNQIIATSVKQIIETVRGEPVDFEKLRQEIYKISHKNQASSTP